MKGTQAGTSEDLWSLLGVDSWLEPLSPALVWAGPGQPGQGGLMAPFPSPVPCAPSLDDLR